MEEEANKITKSNKENFGGKFLVIIAIILILVFIFFGAKIYLMINYLLGNDVLINTIPNTESLFLVHGESKPVKFQISVLANPFCQVECSYIFEDVSENKTYDDGTLNAKLTNSIEKRYTLAAPIKGVGQKLYRFSTSCTAIKTALCNTDGKLTKKSVLVTLNYNYTSEEQKIRKAALENYPIYLELFNNLTEEIYGLNKTIQQIDNLSVNEYKRDLILIENKNISEQIKKIFLLWNSEELLEIGNILPEFNKTLTKTYLDFRNLNKGVLEEIENYNNLILNISAIESELRKYISLNFTNLTASGLDEKIIEFNSLKNSFLLKENISNRKIRFDEFYNNYTNIKAKMENEINNSVDKNFQSSKTISDIPLKAIFPEVANNLTFIDYKLEEPTASCCFKEKCYSCCDNSCYNNKTLYPIIFIHGHDFSASISPEYNLEVFGDMQNKLEEEGYVNAGSILINVPESTMNGIWGETPNPISVKASYYFDTIKNESAFNALQSKKDNIDTYSIRLKNIIDTVKYKTNKEKIILVSHSMGGLVVRRYVQLFGEDSIDKIIMITSPNKGIEQGALNLCRLFGAQKECDDMDENSALINKLNGQTGFKIPVYNIIGVGCNTYGKNGDGIVTNSSAYLDWAKNYYISGTCQNTEFKYLHTEIISPDKYPQNYEIVKEILRGKY